MLWHTSLNRFGLPSIFDNKVKLVGCGHRGPFCPLNRLARTRSSLVLASFPHERLKSAPSLFANDAPVSWGWVIGEMMRLVVTSCSLRRGDGTRAGQSAYTGGWGEGGHVSCSRDGAIRTPVVRCQRRPLTGRLRWSGRRLGPERRPDGNGKAFPGVRYAKHQTNRHTTSEFHPGYVKLIFHA